jgi:hypothetical protein
MFRVKIEYIDDQDSICDAKVAFADDCLAIALAKALTAIRPASAFTDVILADTIDALNDHGVLRRTDEPFEGYHEAVETMIQGAIDLSEGWSDFYESLDDDEELDLSRPPDPSDPSAN